MAARKVSWKQVVGVLPAHRGHEIAPHDVAVVVEEPLERVHITNRRRGRRIREVAVRLGSAGYHCKR